MLKMLLTVLIVTLVLSGCAGTYHAYLGMFKAALKSPVDVALPYSIVATSEYDYLYVRYGDNPQIALALNFIEHGQLKWRAADNNFIFTHHGRIVRTMGLDNDLIFVTNKLADPLISSEPMSKDTTWVRLTDWSSAEFGYPIRSYFTHAERSELTFFGHDIPVIKITERVRFDAESAYIHVDEQWENIFWVEAKTGKTLKTRQRLRPGMPYFELIFISEVVRSLKQANKTVSAEAI